MARTGPSRRSVGSMPSSLLAWAFAAGWVGQRFGAATAPGSRSRCLAARTASWYAPVKGTRIKVRELVQRLVDGHAPGRPIHDDDQVVTPVQLLQQCGKV